MANNPTLSFLWRTLVLAAACHVGARAGPVLDRIRQTGTLVIANREASVPFSYLDARGKPIGYAIDLCLKIADEIRTRLAMRSLRIDYLTVTPATRIATVASGKADLECGSTTNNAERRRQVAFAIPHFISGARYLVRADSPILELPDFEGRTLVSTRGTTPLEVMSRENTQHALGIRTAEVPDHQRAVEMVQSGAADGFVMDDVLLYGLVASSKDPQKLKVVGKYLTIEPYGIMMSKDDRDLKVIADGVMRRLILSHEADALYDRWFMRPIPPRNVALHLPMSYLLRDFWLYPSDSVPF